jgi:hypothetical protein
MTFRLVVCAVILVLLGAHQELRLVLYVNRDLGQRIGVLTGMVRAEQQFCGSRKQYSDVCPGAATVADVQGGQGLGWG